MRAQLKSMAGKALALLGAGLLFCTGTAPAQVFEGNYGAAHCREGGRSVIPVTEGGYISVGHKSCEDCGNNDIYVVRTFNHGNLFWSTTYDLGGNDIATSVKEVFENGKFTGFIITGHTENLNSPADCNSRNDAFLLRIDRCGKLIWVKTYGDPKATESGQEVEIATTGGGGTNAGDFIVAGWTTYNASSGTRNGYIFRTDANGVLIWDAVYDGPDSDDDYLYSVDEAIVAGGAPADIVAAGGTRSYNYPAKGNQGWILRVDGTNGNVGAAPQGAAAYGGDKFEEFKSIRELQIGFLGELVATGYTTSVSGDRDVYVVKTKQDPCTFLADQVFGDLNNLPDEGMAIREINFPGPFYGPGDLVVTGYMHAAPGKGFGLEDVFLQILDGATLKLLPACVSTLYRGDDKDIGFSVEPLPDKYPCRSPGFIVTGFTQSQNIIAPDPQQLYLLKTDDNLGILPGVCSIEYKVECKEPFWKPDCKEPDITKIWKHCTVKTEPRCHYEWRINCFDRLKTELCELKLCELCPLKDDGAKRLTGTSSENVTSSVVALSGFPNPVKSGNALTLEYVLLKDAPMVITISDLTGRTVYNGALSGKSGSGSASVGTEGWASGSYIVSLSVDGKATTTRIVVTE